MSNKKGNIYVKHGNSGVYLYTNKVGDRLPRILRDALKRGKDRWGDTPTTTRIIFSELIQLDIFGTNSFAISPTLGDNENLILVVDDQAEKVGVFGESGQKFKEFTFEEFINISDSSATWRGICRNSIEDDSGVNRRRVNPYQF